MAALTLPLSEVFGPVWQGEGPHAGRVCAFVRLGLCNLTCEWCDTAYTWDESRFDVAEECPETAPEAILGQLEAIPAKLIILSGGEPLMHQRKPAMAELLELDREWHVETNGTLAPTQLLADRITHFTVSPKLITRDPESKRIRAVTLTRFVQLGACFKFVARTAEDVDAAARLVELINIPTEQVWMMPEGTEPGPLLDNARAIAPRTAEHGFNFTLRQQTLLYGAERGR